ncbi:hypothetical protein E8D34_11300 [Nocardioides sp. GY 10113]|uniref:hypothetical protein n=1 Tax=Nocardioides sp. GY 10113 TaxID=2569761 RepID=UPI0010A7CB8F|nr:hypothetical protein [Nocardioides sp. GY 10113]TIC86814.1 hypothetical protein E8D34_11300 [Nocardioides sp. GY 10113]
MTDVEARPAPPSRDDLAAGFDAFYKEARGRLLLQAFALTGDLTASRSAVREAFVVAWHHWRKLSHTDAPERQVRPRAWRNAQRRASTKPWGRGKDVDEETRATLAALAGLSANQRAALLLTQLAAVTMPEMAREVGLPLEAAERELQAAAAQFALQRDIPTSAIPFALAELGKATAGVTWPRASILRRAGAARRRAHTIVGATTAVACLLAAGALVGDATGARPTLDRAETPTAQPSQPPAVQVSLPDTALLPLIEVRGRLAGGRAWQEGRTTDNSTGNGLVHPCQSTRYADPQGVGAWVRPFRLNEDGVTRRFVQTAEASSNRRAAQRSFRTSVGWFAACTPPANQDRSQLPHTQLLSTADVPDLGDQAALLLLRDTGPETDDPDRTVLAGVARTGKFVTVTSLRTEVAPGRADRQAIADLLSTAVNRLCDLADGGACAPASPPPVDRDPFPIGRTPALLSEIDLPPVGTGHGALVGTPAREVTGGRGEVSVGCSTVLLRDEFRGAKVRRNLFRTFVFVDSDLPETAGLTQVVGSLPAARAAAFAELMRSQVEGCPDQEASAGTTVTRLATEDDGTGSLSAWRLVTELPGDRTVEYQLAAVRGRTALTQLLYVAAPDARMSDADFVALARRAQQRIGEMPAY